MGTPEPQLITARGATMIVVVRSAMMIVAAYIAAGTSTQIVCNPPPLPGSKRHDVISRGLAGAERSPILQHAAAALYDIAAAIGTLDGTPDGVCKAQFRDWPSRSVSSTQSRNDDLKPWIVIVLATPSRSSSF
jgi:hypothetical protein